MRAAIVAGILSLVPFLYAFFIARQPGTSYVGMQTAVDDNMVYAAWMTQAMKGSFLFDNRFAIEQQPSLFFHAWFLILGWIAKVTGIPWALALTRALFSGVAVWAAYQLIRRTVVHNYHQKLAVTVVTIGAGAGFLAWAQTGRLITGSSVLSSLTDGRLPIDVWQPEAFVFPSMLVNGLFMVSLSLILAIFVCVIDAQYSWKPVVPGALCFLALMNIHSYDVLLVVLVLVGLLASAAVARNLTGAWVSRVVIMGLGAIPTALWFLYMLKNDPVFQARAATETFAANFKPVLIGFLPLLILGMVAIAAEAKDDPARKRILAGLGGFYAVLIVLFVLASPARDDTYFLTMGAWIGVFILVAGAAALMATENPGRNLVVSWACIGLIAPYFPALFQRKLAMGLAVPWAILAAIGFGFILSNRERGVRNLVAVFGLLLIGATSVRWLARELEFAKMGYGTTLQNPLYLPNEITDMIAKASALPGNQVVLVHPGIPMKDAPAYMPDYNPYFSGLGGVYTYAGHWSESPDYNTKRSAAGLFFTSNVTDEQRLGFLKQQGITLIVTPVAAAFPEMQDSTKLNMPIPDLRGLGKVIAGGSQFELIQVSQ